ncbi:MAG TPA: histidine kinase [Steroidobacteraceae bacterium]
MNSVTANIHNKEVTPQQQIQIARAKGEWESLADSLTQLICLVDDTRRIVRVNRAIESWQLGSVQQAAGGDIHDMLHPHVCKKHCTLAGLLDDGWAKVQGGSSFEFELFDERLARALTVALRPITGAPVGRVLAGHARAVMVVVDVTPLRMTRLALEKLNENLEQRVLERTRELDSVNRGLQNEIARREAAEDALRCSRNELSLLSQQLMQAQEKERRRIAQELHDSVGQSLGAIKYSLERAAELQRLRKHDDAHPLLTRTVGRVKETMREIHAIAMDLRPSILDDLGVASALGWLCREFADTYPQFEVHANISAADTDVPARLVTTIFRCAQELLNNVAKHSQARHVSVALLRDPSNICLMVCDDGIGLPHPDSSGSYGRGHGIRNLRERAQMTAGKMTLGGDHAKGTRVQIDWALAACDLATGAG